MARSVQGDLALQLPLQVALLATFGCASAPPAAPAHVDTTPVSHTDNAALELAQRLVYSFGYDHLPQVAQLNFRYVFESGDEAVFTATHHWDLAGHRDRVVWRDPDGHRYDALLDLQTGVAHGYVDEREAEGDLQDVLSSKAQQRFSVDTYYLALPMRLFDPESHLIHGGEGRLDGRTVEILEVHPDAPRAPVLRLYVDPEGLRVHRSEVAIDGHPEQLRGASWDAYRPVGPLLLAHEHRLDSRGHRMVLEEASALPSVDHQIMTPEPQAAR
ncbi:MAG: hypothetical protein KC933_14070 [Myxococcales bacterium]|nr:hypothetical protein [Myxococcales bacterium]MCB9645931.1 hypothetical protein [Deltaproteobacteria bacterium]